MAVKNFNNLIQPLLTDKYQISMCYSYWKDGKHDEFAVFDLYFRKNPFKGEYTIFAGLDECLKYIKNFQFTEDDTNYLKSISDYSHIEEEFWIYLKTLRTESVQIHSLVEGTVCFPNLPLLRVEGPLGLVQLIETTLLNLINFASLIATNAARYKLAANSGTINNCKLLEFGLRRAQGPDGGLSASRYAYIGGFDATSNLLAGKQFNIPVSGTLSHAYIMSYFGTDRIDLQKVEQHKFVKNLKTLKEENFTILCLDIEQDFMNRGLLNRKSRTSEKLIRGESSEFKSFISFASAFPKNFLTLVDTYDVIKSGLPNFCIVAIALLKFGYKPIGVRIDSGDLAYLSKCARSLFTTVGRAYNFENQFNDFEIVATNDINEETINSLNDQDHAITSMGIGTHLVTCQSQPALGCVYKLVEANGHPCMKLSSAPEKITIPCKKSIYRMFGRNNMALLDLITIADEPQPKSGVRILCRHPFTAEKRCYATPTRVEPLLTLFWDGKLLENSPTISETRVHCGNSLNYITDDIKRCLNPTPYKVAVSEKLFNLLNDLRINLTPIGELA